MDGMGRRVSDFDRVIGDRVRTARMMRGYSQERLGTALGITFQQVQKYERGTNRISASSLLEIARTLDMDILFFFRDERTAGAPFEFVGASRMDFRIMQGLLKVPDGLAKRGIAQLVEALEATYAAIEQTASSAK
jgi:transcriptional regulator with XRE-family HTH domain